MEAGLTCPGKAKCLCDWRALSPGKAVADETRELRASRLQCNDFVMTFDFYSERDRQPLGEDLNKGGI